MLPLLTNLASIGAWLFWEYYLKHREFFKKHPVLREGIDVSANILFSIPQIAGVRGLLKGVKEAKGIKKLWKTITGVGSGIMLGWQTLDLGLDIGDMKEVMTGDDMEFYRRQEAIRKRIQEIDRILLELDAIKQAYPEAQTISIKIPRVSQIPIQLPDMTEETMFLIEEEEAESESPEISESEENIKFYQNFLK